MKWNLILILNIMILSLLSHTVYSQEFYVDFSASPYEKRDVRTELVVINGQTFENGDFPRGYTVPSNSTFKIRIPNIWKDYEFDYFHETVNNQKFYSREITFTVNKNLKFIAYYKAPDAKRIIEFSPNSIDLESLMNKSSTKTLVIKNSVTSNQNLSGSVLTLSDEPFSIIGGAGTFNLVPGNSHTVTIKFAPKSVGSFSDELKINHNATNQSSPSTINLFGLSKPDWELAVAEKIQLANAQLYKLANIMNHNIDPVSQFFEQYAPKRAGYDVSGIKEAIDRWSDIHGEPSEKSFNILQRVNLALEHVINIFHHENLLQPGALEIASQASWAIVNIAEPAFTLIKVSKIHSKYPDIESKTIVEISHEFTSFMINTIGRVEERMNTKFGSQEMRIAKIAQYAHLGYISPEDVVILIINSIQNYVKRVILDWYITQSQVSINAIANVCFTGDIQGDFNSAFTNSYSIYNQMIDEIRDLKNRFQTYKDICMAINFSNELSNLIFSSTKAGLMAYLAYRRFIIVATSSQILTNIGVTLERISYLGSFGHEWTGIGCTKASADCVKKSFIP